MATAIPERPGPTDLGSEGLHEATHYDELNEAGFNNVKEVVARLNEAAPSLLDRTLSYDQVLVVVVYWEEGEVQDVKEYARQLRALFADTYGFKTIEIALKSSGAANQFLATLIRELHNIENQQQDTQNEGAAKQNLLILYYGGHAIVKEVNVRSTYEDRYLWAARNFPNAPSIDWGQIRNNLYEQEFDILFVFDCCYAGAMVDKRQRWKRRCELLAAAGVTEQAGGSAGSSFTRALIAELEERKDRPNFLASEIRTTLSNRDKIREYCLQATPLHERFSSPRYDNIRLGRLGLLCESESRSSSMTLQTLRDSTDARMLIKIRFCNPSESTIVEQILTWLKSELPSDIEDISFAAVREMKIHSLFKSDSSLAIISLPIWFWDVLPNSPAYQAIGIVRSGELLRSALNPLGETALPVVSPSPVNVRVQQEFQPPEVSADAPARAAEGKYAPWKTIPSTDPSASASTANVALMYASQADWNVAEELYKKIIGMRTKTLGADHPDTLTSMVNLTSIYENEGRWDEAEELDEQIVERRSKVLGAEHPETLTSMAALALIYKKQGRRWKAEKLYNQVVATRRRILGGGHPDTLVSMANLASIYADQGRQKEAEELNKQVMEIAKRFPGTANFASMSKLQGWRKEAELSESRMETGLGTVGAERFDMPAAMVNLASIYTDQNRWQEAEQLYKNIVEMRMRAPGAGHPDTLTSMDNLASIYKNQGRWSEAEKLYKQIMAARRRTLGPEHPDTLTIIANLASMYKNQHRWNEAEELYKQIMAARRRALGAEHSDTLESMANLASIYIYQGQWEKAQRLYESLVEIRKRVPGIVTTRSPLRTMESVALSPLHHWASALEPSRRYVHNRY